MCTSKKLNEITSIELVINANRKNSFTPKRIRYLGFSFRLKQAIFNTGKYAQKVRFLDYSIISRLKGTDKEKLQIVIDGNVSVDCSCPDFLYGGFKYMGTQLDYSVGKENRPPDVRNPKLDGTVCKHLKFLLDNLDNYLDSIARDINKSRKVKGKTIKRGKAVVNPKKESFSPDIEKLIDEFLKK